MTRPPGGVSRRTLARLGLAAGLAASLFAAAGHARSEAAFMSCTSDPIVVVNGAQADIVSTLSTQASAVRELDYTITVPKGSLIGKTTLTVGLGFPEKVTYIYSSSLPWGSLKVDATVQTADGVAPFPTAVRITSPEALLTLSKTASGMSNSTVTVGLNGMVML
jgi:hypothetical protein